MNTVNVLFCLSCLLRIECYISDAVEKTAIGKRPMQIFREGRVLSEDDRKIGDVDRVVERTWKTRASHVEAAVIQYFSPRIG